VRAPAFLRRRTTLFAALLGVVFALGFGIQRFQGEPRFLTTPPAEFVASFSAPPAADSLQTRRELEELLALQQRRTEREIEAARADRKTEVWQFAAALGLRREQIRGLRLLDALAAQVEDDERSYVRAAKHRFLRLRPYEVDARIEPCIDHVSGDLSYPSGHATYGYLMAYLLADMVPERRAQLIARAEEFARQRMVCGVHFPSDVAAGRIAAAWLAQRMLRSLEYREAAAAAAHELRAALGLPVKQPAARR
jgi:acid phosphatase (class A)